MTRARRARRDVLRAGAPARRLRVSGTPVAPTAGTAEHKERRDPRCSAVDFVRLAVRPGAASGLEQRSTPTRARARAEPPRSLARPLAARHRGDPSGAAGKRRAPTLRPGSEACDSATDGRGANRPRGPDPCPVTSRPDRPPDDPLRMPCSRLPVDGRGSPQLPRPASSDPQGGPVAERGTPGVVGRFGPRRLKAVHAHGVRADGPPPPRRPRKNRPAYPGGLTAPGPRMPTHGEDLTRPERSPGPPGDWVADRWSAGLAVPMLLRHARRRRRRGRARKGRLDGVRSRVGRAAWVGPFRSGDG